MSTDLPWTRTLAGRPSLGSHAERSRTTTMRDVEMFTEMTGDRNPIHYDVELATKSPFGGLIVQGGVTTGLLNAVVAEDLPGPGTVFLETNWRFVQGSPRRRDDHRQRQGRARSGRQADLQARNHRPQRERANLRGRHRYNLHDAAASVRERRVYE